MATLPKSAPTTKKSTANPTTVPAAQAKTHLLELLDTVDRDREAITITRHGRPVAQLIPFQAEARKPLWGCMKGTIKITGDIVGPEPDIWEAMSE